MDVYIILHSCIVFFVFLVLHVVVLRRISENGVFRWIAGLYCCVGLLGLCVPVIVPFHGISGTGWIVPEMAVYFLLYSLWVMFFVLAFFGIAVTSLRINMLVCMFRQKTMGLSRRDLMVRYGSKEIVRKRLDRLVGSGELKIVDGRYVVDRKLTFFVLFTNFLVLLNRMYGTSAYRDIG